MHDELAGKTILVIEDDYWIADALVSVLRQAGATVIGPIGALDEAKAVAGECHADAALVDVNLGGEESYPAVDILQQRRIDIVFMTGYDRSSIHAAYAHHRICAKPFVRQDIIDALVSPRR